ncbi:uncharacterized protein TRUGW13939_04139 [Talaromyces rugulosus]|uniref:Aminoglycoside phosphotransferase domain-containing protein n=1 Tax=Talaromyces rugulosus TaxID=121627 RepID=A0A7H8QU37_TALRU|nr:uncharacterized protein TRUGW13939_04139 [Talaromyces rugulosus]QKX57031.1 hypothetical protein TRUGW13939_04139 [Talaromyces rugulosus]
MEETIAELRRQLEEAERRQEEAERRQKEAELRVQPNTLSHLLDRCHNSLSQAIRVETKATLTTQGDATDPVNRLYPHRIVPWLDFSRLQEQVWKKLGRTAAFTSRPLFPSDNQLDYVAMTIQNKPIYSEDSLQNFERRTVDTFVEMAIEKLQDDETLRHEFGIQGRVTFYDRANPAETLLENSLGQMNLQDVRLPNTRKGRRARRRNRRADQSCVHIVADERKEPVYAVEFKAPHKVTIPELVAGLHQMDLDRDVIGQEGDTFEFYATYLIAAVITQIFSYMIDIVRYFLCVPNQDVQVNDELRLHRTAIGQMLAFTLQALAAEAPSQEWHDVADDKLKTWEVEYLNVLRKIPETLRNDPPASNYRASHWKREPKTHDTRCQSTKESESTDNKQTSRKGGQSTRPYCTTACIRGMVNRDPLDKECPNWKLHGGQRHSMGPREFTRRLHRQLARNRNHGFEQLHVCGRTGYLIKATLLLRGYTVIIKATTADKHHFIQTEADNYRYLRSLQGKQIPVCLGTFTPRVSYWYHGQLMEHMMILSWSGSRLQHVINDENSSFFHQEREKALAVLRSHGMIHGDCEWRNMLWDELSSRLIVIDLEDVKWLLNQSLATRRDHRVGAGKSRQWPLSSSTTVCT